GIAVVVDVGECATHGDLIRHGQPGSGGDVHEPTTAEVLPELVGAELREEIEIGEAVAIDVGRAQAAAVVVVSQLVRLARVVDHPVHERDAAGLPPIRESEVVHQARLRGHLGLLAGALQQPYRATGRAARHGEERHENEEYASGHVLVYALPGIPERLRIGPCPLSRPTKCTSCSAT